MDLTALSDTAFATFFVAVEAEKQRRLAVRWGETRVTIVAKTRYGAPRRLTCLPTDRIAQCIADAIAPGTRTELYPTAELRILDRYPPGMRLLDLYPEDRLRPGAEFDIYHASIPLRVPGDDRKCEM